MPAPTPSPPVPLDALTQFQQYVAVHGNDARSGKDWQHAKATIEAALTAIEAAGGGELHLEEGIPLGKIWLRGDGISVPGFHGDFPLKVTGYTGLNWGLFGEPVASVLDGTGADRFHPSIWIVSTSRAKVFKDLASGAFQNNCPIRMWDFRRDSSGNLIQKNISSWTRSGTSATVVLTLPTAVNITSASRVGNVVTIAYATTGNETYPLPGQWVRIASTNGSFDSGDFLVSGDVSGTPGHLSYHQTTSSGSASGTNIGTIQTHEVRVRDRIEVVSSEFNVPGTMYRCTATGPDAATITVEDLYGGKDSYSGNYATSGTWTNFGTWTRQMRDGGSSLVFFDNVVGTVAGVEVYDVPQRGPAYDFGGSADGRIYIKNTSQTGYLPSNGIHDPDRQCWLLMDAGSANASGCFVRDCNPAGGGIRQWASPLFTWGCFASNICGDIPVGTIAPPAYECIDGNRFGIVQLYNVRNWDSPGTPDVVLSGVGQGSSAINCGLVSGGITTVGCYSADPASSWVNGQPGIDGTGRLIGQHPAGRRAVGPLSYSRFGNFVVPTASWEPGAGATVTTGILDPFGGHNAVKVTGAAGVYVHHQDDAIPLPAIGDAWIMAGWFRRAGGWGTGGGFLMGSCITASNLGAIGEFGTALYSGFGGDGEWQWLSSIGINTVAPTGSSYGLRFALSPQDSTGYEVYGLVGIRIPAAAALTKNELYEFVQNMSHQAQYMAAGQFGTMDGVRFIAHGGLGMNSTNATTVGGGSGQAVLGSNTKVVPLYDKDGTTILGYIPLYAVTFNP
jgi:hypothetical protein